MGRRKGSGGVEEKRRKRVTVRLVNERDNAYRVLKEVRNKDHAHLAEAKIGLAWRMGWKADTDKHLKLGQCRKRGDLDRELDQFDFIILLNDEAWPRLTEDQKRALIDHELCHAALSMDADGGPKYNDRDRLVCRIKRHEVEEFRCIVERHGLWTQDLSAIAQAAVNDSKRPLLNADNPTAAADETVPIKPPSPNGWKRLPVSCLGEYGLPAGKVKLLEEADLSTMGKLMDRIKKAGAEDFWWKDIKGFGESGYDALVDAIMALRKNKPEFQDDAA
jgi:hypothetical protein